MQEHYITQVLFMSTNFIYTLMSLVLYTGPPYRQRFWTNYLYLANLVSLVAVAVGIIFDQSERFGDFFEFYFPYQNSSMTGEDFLWLDSTPVTNDADFPEVRWM